MVTVNRRGSVAAVLLATLLGGCTVQREAVMPGAGAAAPAMPLAAAPSSPDVPSLTEERCLDEGDFAPMSDPTPGNNQRRALVSRHVDCRRGESGLVQLWGGHREGNADHGGATPAAYWSGARGPATSGTVRFASKFSVYGPPNVLQKRVSLTLRAIDFTLAPQSSADRMEPVQVMPIFSCGPAKDLFGEPPACSLVLGKPIVVRLDGREASGDFVIDFNWAQPPTQRKDVVTFFLRFDTFAYSVGGAVFDVASGEAQVFDSGLDGAGILVRCDRGVAKAGTKGCVFPQAAAVFSVSGVAEKGAEAVSHMEAAIEHGAPGRFRMRPGFRTIADEESTGQSAALRRTQIAAMRDANRYASCANVGTSIISRHPQRSASCPNGRADPCDCDEYPFASTYQGAFQNRETTSARFISPTDNRAVGSALAEFYTRQRVIDMSYETGERGTLTNPYPSFVLDESGDSFWVHISPN